jgi:hypothetical protein
MFGQVPPLKLFVYFFVEMYDGIVPMNFFQKPFMDAINVFVGVNFHHQCPPVVSTQLLLRHATGRIARARVVLFYFIGLA